MTGVLTCGCGSNKLRFKSHSQFGGFAINHWVECADCGDVGPPSTSRKRAKENYNRMRREQSRFGAKP